MVLGFGMLLVGASGVFGELQSSLNEIWNVATPSHPFFELLRERAISFVMVLVMSLLMLGSFLVSAAEGMAGKYLHGVSAGLDGLWQLGTSGVSLLLTAGLFAVIYRLVPDPRILWRDVWAGAVIAAALFELGKWALGIYLGRSAIASSYGAAGPLVIVLVWVFYSAQIFLCGAEFTRVYTVHRGSRQFGDAAPQSD